jgi:hypothetical protein
MIAKNSHSAEIQSGSYSRPKRSSAIKAVEKITAILKEERSSDEYGYEIEVDPSPSPPTTTATTTSESINEKYNAYRIYSSMLKPIHVENIKKYLSEIDAHNKHIVIPELMKYLIINPSMMVHSLNFRNVVVNKMIEFENEMKIAPTIGNYRITEEYRREFSAMATILKKIANIYKKLNVHEEEFYKNIETVANEL